MRKHSILGMILILLLAGCAPSFEDKQEVVQDSKDKKETAIIPKYKISEEYYQTILPFEPSKARGLVVSNLNTRYDIEEFENGLMRLAQTQFDPEDYLFQEGQMLDSSKISSWLNRKYTDSQLKEKKMKASENLGLNPVDPGKGDIDKRNDENPIYLAHILEHNYLVKTKDNSVSLGGVVIGLALNSVHYYQKEAFGATYENKIDSKKLKQEGEKIAAVVLKRLRNMDKLKNVPITIALFEQNEKSSVVPGNFISYTNIDKNSNNIGKWTNLDEEYFLFPSAAAEKKNRDDVNTFTNFKEDVEEYFPNFNGVIGRAFYMDDQLQSLNIDIPIQFYGNSEAIGFTQYVAGLIMERFPNYIAVQVSITSVNGPEALIVREANQDEPTVHIYE
ncbi:CamS family sex pheromone protein [Peribacillus frigoritolerans]|uniref:CamS family sex pheromone protein n=1 Tax=Peribacillus frigoritolerans TaxID=450367 RepID=UPI002231B7C5|nr:CamS family sex pheromone protein [Peribacillus frigoritolerans]UZD47359.1 CamS family sex pheromone protein [Peribacillus frigoritolerans]WHX62460.1 CamS family sex pheromone protein [Peribacillus frigoritolerans]